MADLIDRQAAIDAIGKAADELYENIKKGATFPQRQWFDGMAQAQSILEDLPSAEQKSGRYVDLSERVIGYYYDDEYEEWIEKTVTVEELLDTACDDYTVVEMPSAQSQRMKGRWQRHYSRPNVYADLCWHCSNCGYASNDNWANKWKYCPNCGAEMENGNE